MNIIIPEFNPSIRVASPTLFLSCLGLLFALSQPTFAAGLNNAPHLSNGQQIYFAHCAGCHGSNGISIMPNAPTLSRIKLLEQPEESLIDLVRSGRNMMPAYFGILSDSEILSVVNYVRGLQ